MTGGIVAYLGNKIHKPFIAHHPAGVSTQGRALFVRATIVTTALLGLTALAGWLFDIPVLRSIIPGAVEMKANTAVCLLLCAGTLWAMAQRNHTWLTAVGFIMAAIVASIGTATLIEYGSGRQLGIDELLFADTANAFNQNRGRMSPYSAIGFLLLGSALIALVFDQIILPRNIAAFLVVVIGSVSLLGYLWNASELVTDQWLPPVAINTAVEFILLGIAVYFAGAPPSGIGVLAHSEYGMVVHRKVLVTFIGGFAVLLATGGYIYQLSATFANSAERVIVIQQIRSNLNELSTLIYGTQSAQRNYQMTGNAAYIQDFRYLNTQLKLSTLALRNLINNEPAQISKFNYLKLLINQREDTLAQEVTRLGQVGPKGAQPLILHELQDQPLQQLIQSMDKIEVARLAANMRQLEHLRQNRLLALLGTVMMTAAGFFLLYRNLVREMRARAQTTETLRVTEQYNRAINDSSVNVLCLLDLDARIIYMTKNSRDMLELDDGVLVENARWDSIWPSAAQPEAQQAIANARLGMQSQFQCGCPSKKSETIWWEVTVTPLLDQYDNTERLLVTMADVTVFRQLMDELCDSSARMQTLLNTVADGILTFDEQGIVRTINPAIERLFGYSSNEIIGRNISTILSYDASRAAQDVGESTSTNHPDRLSGSWREIQGMSRDGRIFPLWFSVAEMWIADGHWFTAVIHDITDMKEAERKILSARDEAVRANAAKDVFLATMSHEIRTPLNGMLGMLELLGLTHLDEEQHETVESSRDSGRTLLRIIDDVLDHAKIEAGKLEINLEPTSISQLLRRVLNTYHSIASAKGLILTQSFDSRIAPLLLADPLRIIQVLSNFVSNAVKFTEHGHVTVRAELLDQTGSAELIRFSAADSGIGISQDAQKLLFQPFQQATANTSRLYGGTGLGLSICRQLASLMGGSLDIESIPGQGTTLSMTISLPLCDSTSAHHSTADKISAQRPLPLQIKHRLDAAPVVLAVDDNPINRKLLVRQLSVLGLQVLQARDGQEALQLWLQGTLSLVITDCNMPGMDGYELARTIREIEEREQREIRTSIIAWTANVMQGSAERCRDAGMDDILIKPAELTQIREVLSRFLSIAEQNNALPALAASQSSDPVDLNVLKKLVGDQPEVINEFLMDFYEGASTMVNTIKAAYDRSDAPAVLAAAHRFKSAARTVGAVTLGDLCHQIENTCENRDKKDLEAQIIAFQAESDRVLNFIDAALQPNTVAQEEP